MELLVVQVQLVQQVQAVHLAMQELPEHLILPVVQVPQDHSVLQEMLELLVTLVLPEQAVQAVQTELRVTLVTAVNRLPPVLLAVLVQQEHQG